MSTEPTVEPVKDQDLCQISGTRHFWSNPNAHGKIECLWCREKRTVPEPTPKAPQFYLPPLGETNT